MSKLDVNVLIILTLTCVVVRQVNAQTTADVKAVITYVFTTNAYNKFIRPADDQTIPTSVYIDFNLNNIISFDEQEESLTTSGYLTITWTDPDLDWTTSSFNEVVGLFIPQDEIWKPDISLRNTIKSLTGLGSPYLNVFVDSSGGVYWTPFQVLTSTCSVDISYFPFDVQTCSMKFIAWSYRPNEVSLRLGSQGINLEGFQSNSAWDVIETSSENVAETLETAVIFHMKLKRKPLFYLLNIVIPVLMLSLLGVCTFVLPVDSGERASYGITNFLSLAVFLTIVSSTLRQNSDKTSLLAIYLMLMTGLSTLTVVISLVEIRLAGRDVADHPIGQPWMALYRISSFLQCKNCGCDKTAIIKVSPETKADIPLTKSNNQHTMSDNEKQKRVPPKDPEAAFLPEKPEPEVDWKSITVAIDYLSFWLFLIMTITVTVVLFVISSSQPNE